MKPYIYPYKLGSHSARALARALGTICVREDGRYAPRKGHLIINWGNPRRPRWAMVEKGYTHVPWLNILTYMPAAQDKLATFKIFEEEKVNIPDWTRDRKVAAEWIKDERLVLCRTLLNSHSGRGITIARTAAELIAAPLYVMYKPKKKEFRVHVFNGKVIDVQQKRLANGAKEEENYNQYIRSHDNGWIFARENIDEPKELRSLAISAVKALGLDFGAVDVIYNEKENKCYCLEVNSAPGLEGQTLVSYTNAIKEYIHANK